MADFPSIEDTGRDGYPFAHIDFTSDPGAWADALRFTVNIKVAPYEPAQSPLDPVEGCGDGYAPASLPGSLSTHAAEIGDA